MMITSYATLMKIREELKNNPEKTYNRVRDLLLKQTGPIVSTEEAAQSEGAAQKLQRQMALLTKGPLAIARTDDEAIKFLDLFRTQNTTAGGNLNRNGALSQILGRGQQRQQERQNPLLAANNSIDAFKAVSQISANELVVKNFSVQNNDSLKSHLASEQQKYNHRAILQSSEENMQRLRSMSSEEVTADLQKRNITNGYDYVSSVVDFAKNMQNTIDNKNEPKNTPQYSRAQTTTPTTPLVVQVQGVCMDCGKKMDSKNLAINAGTQK